MQRTGGRVCVCVSIKKSFVQWEDVWFVLLWLLYPSAAAVTVLSVNVGDLVKGVGRK